jgi:hypothetical protein
MLTLVAFYTEEERHRARLSCATWKSVSRVHLHCHIISIRIQDRIWASRTNLRTVLMHFVSSRTISDIAVDFQDYWCISLGVARRERLHCTERWAAIGERLGAREHSPERRRRVPALGDLVVGATMEISPDSGGPRSPRRRRPKQFAWILQTVTSSASRKISKLAIRHRVNIVLWIFHFKGGKNTLSRKCITNTNTTSSGRIPARGFRAQSAQRRCTVSSLTVT